MNKNIGLLVFLLIASTFLFQQLFAADQAAREWETADGKYKVTATLKQFDEKEGKAILIKKDGKEITVPLAKLSKKDQDFLKNNTAAKPIKKSDLDDFGKDDDTPSKPGSDEKSEQKPTATKTVKKSEPLSAEDEKSAKELVEEMRVAFRPQQQPKWQKVWSVPAAGKLDEISFSQSPERFITAMGNGVSEIRELSDGSLVRAAEKSLVGNTHRVAISPDAKYVLTTSQGKGVVYWNAETGEKIFSRTDKKAARFQNSAVLIQNGKAMIFDRRRVLHLTDENANGDEETVVENDDNLLASDLEIEKKKIELSKEATESSTEEDKEAEVQSKIAWTPGLSVSPDGKKYVTWRTVQDQLKVVNLNQLEAKQKRPALRINTIPNATSAVSSNHRVAGALATNDVFAYMLSNGSLYFISTELPQTEQPVPWRYFSTSIRNYHVRSINSADGKFGAFFNPQQIFMFRSDAPNDGRTISIPVAEAEGSSWLHPDFLRLVNSDGKNLILWKASNPGYLKQIGSKPVLLAKLIQERKFQVIERAYALLEADPEAIKELMFSSWTSHFLAHFGSTMTRTYARGDKTVFADLGKWRESNPDNQMMTLYLANMLISEGWSARGSGSASTVTAEGWKVFQEKITRAKGVLRPLMSREHVSVDAIESWMRICKADHWDPKDVLIGIELMIKNYPLSSEVHSEIIWSLLPRWHGQPGEVERYCEKVADSVDPKHGDAIYAVMAATLITRADDIRKPDSLFQIDSAKFPTLDSTQPDWDRMARGVDQLNELFPDDSRAVSLGVFFGAANNDIEMARKYLKILDEKHDGIPSGSKLTYYSLNYIRKAVRKQAQ